MNMTRSHEVTQFPAPTGHAEDVHAPVRDLDDEQYVQAFEEDRVHVEEIAGQQAVGLGAEEGPPGGIDVARGWPSSGAQDPPHGGRAGVAVDLGELAFGSGQADVQAFDFAGPAVALGFGDAVDQGVADLGDAGPLGGVGADQIQ
jgi:hypothetical protein